MKYNKYGVWQDQLCDIERFANDLLVRMADPGSGSTEVPTALRAGTPAPLQRVLERNRGMVGPLVGAFHEFCEVRDKIDGKIKFCRESQGGHFWTYEPGSQNPSVWLHWENDSLPPIREEGLLCEFLVQLLVFEFIVGASYKRGRFNLPNERVSSLLSDAERVPVSPWRYPAHPAEFFAIGDGFAFIYPVSPSNMYFSFGAETEDAIKALDALSSWDWMD